MKIKHSLPRSLAARSALAVTALISVPAAHAFYNNSPIGTPEWAGMVYNSVTRTHCSGFQIGPRLMVTTARCANTYVQADNGDRAIYFRTMGSLVPSSDGWFVYEGSNSYGPVGDIGIVITPSWFDYFDQGTPWHPMPYETANIMSYKDEMRALRDGDDAMSQGAALSLFSLTPGDRSQRLAVKSEGYFNVQVPTREARPLIYRSVSKYRELEPARFTINTSNPLGDPFVLDYLYQTRKLSDQQVDSMVLLTSGLEDDTANGIGNPITPSDTSGGVFYKATDGKQSLVGLISSQNVQPRLSYHWPWIYQKIKQKLPKADAIAFANKVLGTDGWDSNNQLGTLGDVYVYDNPFNGDVEFFKLIGLKSDQRYGYFPTNKTNNQYWQYLGTSLPTLEQATSAIR